MPRQHDVDAVFAPAASFYHHQYHSSTSVFLGLTHHYLRYASEDLCPLDLSLKAQHNQPITPPCTPPTSRESSVVVKHRHQKADGTPPASQHKAKSPSHHHIRDKKTRATRKLNFDEDIEDTSPVSGTIIRQLAPDEHLVVRKGDIDPAFNVVEVTEEAKAELAKIENHIGDYVCRLCKQLYEDAFTLAQHRCSRIVHVEYRCPECDKVFNCPANLASHRRWHKPRDGRSNINNNNNNNNNNRKEKSEELLMEDDRFSMLVDNNNDSSIGEQFPCSECGKRFRRLAYLRKHQAVHQVD